MRDYHLDAEGAHHGLRVATFAAELTAHLGEAYYLGKSPSDERLRHELFHRELVEIFLGGFLHDAGLWGDEDPVGHESTGAGIVARIPHIAGIAESMVDTVLFHSDLAGWQQAPESSGPEEGRDSEPVFSAHYHESLDSARKQIAAEAESATLKLLRNTDLKRILPVALAEYFVSHTEGPDAVPPRMAIGAAVGFGDNELYTRFLVPLCNSQPEAVAPRRALVSLAGHLPLGRQAAGELMDLDGDVGISVLDDGPRRPTWCGFRNGNRMGGCAGSRQYRPRRGSHRPIGPESYMHIPIGRELYTYRYTVHLHKFY